jgi:hypothetical protein
MHRKTALTPTLSQRERVLRKFGRHILFSYSRRKIHRRFSLNQDSIS